jgi:hypothetical protein
MRNHHNNRFIAALKALRHPKAGFRQILVSSKTLKRLLLWDNKRRGLKLSPFKTARQD